MSSTWVPASNKEFQEKSFPCGWCEEEGKNNLLLYLGRWEFPFGASYDSFGGTGFSEYYRCPCGHEYQDGAP